MKMRGDDALTTSNLKDVLLLENKQEEILEKDWDKMNRTTCGVIKSFLTQDLKYYVINETSMRKIWEILEAKYLIKSVL